MSSTFVNENKNDVAISEDIKYLLLYQQDLFTHDYTHYNLGSNMTKYKKPTILFQHFVKVHLFFTNHKELHIVRSLRVYEEMQILTEFYCFISCFYWKIDK